MQIPILHRRGQARPFGSIPRINWGHPLAQGLTFYVLDTGSALVDIVNGGANLFGSGNVSKGVYRYGSGFNYPGTNGTNNYAYMPATVAAKNLTVAAPWTSAVGTFYTGAPTANVAIACTSDSGTSGDTGVAFFSNGTTGVIHYFNNGGSNAAFTQTISANTFQTWVVVATSSTAATLYANGAQDSTASGLTTTFSLTGGRISLHNDGSAANSDGGIKGFIPYFAGWQRTLAADEARLLHDDPYCFLIFPEDEIFATLVGVAAAIAAPILDIARRRFLRR